ncbi:hypothetical protein WN943_023446 [Citrus x changshan-huyou]
MTKFRKLNRPTGHRMSMLRTMVSQLVKHERIETTVAKAKEVRRLADNMVQLGKEIISQEQSRTSLCSSSSGFSMGILNENPTLRIPPPEVNESETSPRPYFVKQGLGLPIKKGSLCAARRAAAFVRGDDVIHKLFTELAYRYKDRAGGYTRLLRSRIRVGDAAPMAYIEFVDRANELRQSKPAVPQPPPRAAMDPWTRSRLTKNFAPPKQEKSSDAEI